MLETVFGDKILPLTYLPFRKEAVPESRSVIPVEVIEKRILFIRDKKVVIDADLAEFYGVSTKRLNEQVRRNPGRFPKDFLFQLTSIEKEQVVANCDHLDKLKYSKVLPFAFTEHGAIMASNVLNSARAIEMGVFVVRAFVNLRRTIENHSELGRKLSQLEEHLLEHDKRFVSIVQAIRSLVGSKEIPKKLRIGFEREANSRLKKGRDR